MNSRPDVRAVLRATARAAGKPVWKRLRPRIEWISREHLMPEFDRLRHDDDRLRDEIANLRRDLDNITRRLDEMHHQVDWLNGENRRISPHIAAQDTRIAELEARDGAPSVERQDEERSEHAKLRARQAAIAHYEERIARLEATLGDRAS